MRRILISALCLALFFLAVLAVVFNMIADRSSRDLTRNARQNAEVQQAIEGRGK